MYTRWVDSLITLLHAREYVKHDRAAYKLLTDGKYNLNVTVAGGLKYWPTTREQEI